MYDFFLLKILHEEIGDYWRKWLLPSQIVRRTVHQNKNIWMLARVGTVPGHHLPK
jgi:hypothetical protein